MAPRPNWKGYLKLALVSCPVALYPAASSSERISFHMMNRNTGHRLKQQYIDAETGELVDSADRVKGYEVARNDYVLLEPEELKDVQIESTHTIDIEHFVPRSEIDPVYYDSTYYIVPDDEVGAEAFAVIREAMRKRDMVGLARVVLYGRALSRIPIVIAYPVQVGACVLIIGAFAVTVFGEKIGAAELLGVALVIAGIALLARVAA